MLTYGFSEKARIPAWTDRILRKGPNLRQLTYDSAPLRFSDHRPVYATFDCKVNIVDEERRESISQDLYQRRKADIGDTTAHIVEGDESEDEELMGYDSIEPGLPPASSDRQKWWLDNRQPARAQIAVPDGSDGQRMGLNPNRPSNPFGHTDESDWVSVPRASPRPYDANVSNSPYEKVSKPRGMPPGSGGPEPVMRKQLPPPFDTSKLPTKVGKLKLDDEVSIKSQPERQTATPPPPPPPRRQTAGSSHPVTSGSGATGFATDLSKTQALAPLPTKPRSGSVASQSSQLSRQSTNRSIKSVPPPVAKKPAHLVTGSPISKTTTGSTVNSGRSDEAASRVPPLPARSASGASQASRQSASARKAVLPAVGGSGPTAVGPGTGQVNGMKPPLPSRQQTGQAAPGSSSVDLLDSLEESGEEMGGWETLQPSSNGH